jgi:hypothetical protein
MQPSFGIGHRWLSGTYTFKDQKNFLQNLAICSPLRPFSVSSLLNFMMEENLAIFQA